MARQLRLEYEGAIYHITARGNERKKIYHSQRDYTKFKEYLKLSKKHFGRSTFSSIMSEPQVERPERFLAG